MTISKGPNDFNSQNYLMVNPDKTEMISGTWQHLATGSSPGPPLSGTLRSSLQEWRVRAQSRLHPFHAAEVFSLMIFSPQISEFCLWAVTEYDGCRHQAGCLGEVPMKWSRPFSCLVFVPPGWGQLPFCWTPCCHTWHPVARLVPWMVSWSRDKVQRFLERTLGDYVSTWRPHQRVGCIRCQVLLQLLQD